ILPAAMLLSQFAEWLLTPLLMLGGAYLCFEGAEKIWEKLAGHHAEDAHSTALVTGTDQEGQMVAGAIRTDFILSAEIMVISLNEVSDEPFLSRLAILVVVALAITALVYGVVGLIVKMDDLGLRLAERPGGAAPAIGRGLVRGMPRLLALLSTVGIAAMLWVGGHILLVGLDDVGWSGPYDAVHHAEEAVADAVGALTGVVAWLVNTGASAVLGIAVGAAIVAVMHLLPRRGAAAH